MEERITCDTEGITDLVTLSDRLSREQENHDAAASLSVLERPNSFPIEKVADILVEAGIDPVHAQEAIKLVLGSQRLVAIRSAYVSDLGFQTEVSQDAVRDEQIFRGLVAAVGSAISSNLLMSAIIEGGSEVRFGLLGGTGHDQATGIFGYDVAVTRNSTTYPLNLKTLPFKMERVVATRAVNRPWYRGGNVTTTVTSWKCTSILSPALKTAIRELISSGYSVHVQVQRDKSPYGKEEITYRLYLRVFYGKPSVLELPGPGGYVTTVSADMRSLCL